MIDQSWVGWVLGAAIVAVFGYLLYRMRKRKATDTRTHHIIAIPSFPITHVPIAKFSPKTAKSLVEELRTVYRSCWDSFCRIYEIDTPRPLPVGTIGMTLTPCAPDHPHVYWSRGGDRIVLRAQVAMFGWFAHELHNLFRYAHFGIASIYESRNAADLIRSQSVVRWINENWGPLPLRL